MSGGGGGGGNPSDGNVLLCSVCIVQACMCLIQEQSDLPLLSPQTGLVAGSTLEVYSLQDTRGCAMAQAARRWILQSCQTQDACRVTVTSLHDLLTSCLTWFLSIQAQKLHCASCIHWDTTFMFDCFQVLRACWSQAGVISIKHLPDASSIWLFACAFEPNMLITSTWSLLHLPNCTLPASQTNACSKKPTECSFVVTCRLRCCC